MFFQGISMGTFVNRDASAYSSHFFAAHLLSARYASLFRASGGGFQRYIRRVRRMEEAKALVSGALTGVLSSGEYL